MSKFDALDDMRRRLDALRRELDELARREVAGSTFTTLQTFSAGISFGNETLSVYDEGTWTPAITGNGGNPTVTYTTQDGYSTRIGNVVHFYGYIVINTISGGGGSMLVSLPGTPSASPNWKIGNALFLDSGAGTWHPGVTLVSGSGSDAFIILNAGFLAVAGLGAGDVIGYSGSYRA